MSWCSHCSMSGHHMSLCYNLKFCKLCGKAGHNPYRCWTFSTISRWIDRAKELDSCESCLTPWKLAATEYNGYIMCKHCREGIRDLDKVQGSQTELQLQEEKTITEKLSMQIKDLNGKILSLESRLERSNETINCLDGKLQNTIKEKELELQKFDKLDVLCKEKEVELRRLWEQIGKKDFELEQFRKTTAQPSQTIPTAVQQPCPTPPSNSFEQIYETNSMKTLINIQDQQQKLTMIVNHLYKKIKTLDMSCINYPSFNPTMGPYDTGQCFNKLQQVY